MTAENLNMAGKGIEDNLYEKGAEVYYFKPPTQAQVCEAGKMHTDRSGKLFFSPFPLSCGWSVF